MTKSKITQEENKLDSFFNQVYAVVRLIPKGRVTSYGAIAKYLGTAKSSRMVGWAMNGAHNVKPKVPAHRVVNRVGLLTGKHHFGDPKAMSADDKQVALQNESLGNIAWRVGRRLNIDPTNGHILNDADAQKLWSRTYENGWQPIL